jgi:hypothetical protein
MIHKILKTQKSKMSQKDYMGIYFNDIRSKFWSKKCHGNINYFEYNSAATTKFAFFPWSFLSKLTISRVIININLSNFIIVTLHEWKILSKSFNIDACQIQIQNSTHSLKSYHLSALDFPHRLYIKHTNAC